MNCQKCGTPLGRDAPGRLCARCQLQSGLSKERTGADLPSPSGAGLGEFGSYTLLAEIGRGGMGIVYRAKDPSMNRLVAIKLIISGPFAGQRELKRFQAEAEAAARLDHPNIVPVYEFGEMEGRRFLSMKLIEGVDLVRRLGGVPMEPRAVAQLLSALARAIHHAHQRGILHRDLKPANVLIDEQDQPHVTDFGLAKLRDRESDLTLSTEILGSPNYMAPEQAAGKADQLTTAADVYSLGAIMYETLTGRPPFKSASPLETMRMVIEVEPIPPHVLYRFADRDLEIICLKCLAKEPTGRYGTALELAEDIERWLRLEPIRARPASVSERVLKWMRRNPKIAALLVLVHVVFVVGISSVLLMSLRLASANRAKQAANLQLEKNIRDFEWQRVDELIATGKRPQALALLAGFLRRDPKDGAAARRLMSMLNQCNFALPAAAPMRHGVGINSLEVSSEGAHVLTAAMDGKARIWDWQSGAVLATFEHPKPVTSARYLANGGMVLTACLDGHARLWDVPTQKAVFLFPQAVHDSGCRLGPNGRVAALRPSEISMQLWDLTHREPLGNELRMASTVRDWVFSPDGTLFAVAAMDGTAYIWRIAESTPLVSTLKVPGDITRALFTPDSKGITLAWGERIGIWDVAQGAKRVEFQAHEAQVLQLGFTADAKRLVTAAYGRPLRIWDTTNFRPLGQPIEAEPPLPVFRLSPDDRRIATSSQSGVCRLWDGFSGLPVCEPFEHAGPVTGLEFSSDGQRLFTASQDGTAQVWKIQNNSPRDFSVPTTDTVPCASFSPDGRFIVRTSRHAAEVFDFQTGKILGQAMPHNSDIFRLAISPDGRTLATAGWDNVGKLWELQTGTPLAPPLKHLYRLFAIEFSPDGRWVGTGAADGRARLFDAKSGAPVGAEMVHPSDVNDVHFRPDGKALLTACTDGAARLWSVPEGKELWTEPAWHKGSVWTAEFSRDSRYVVTASEDRTAVIRDALTGRPVAAPLRHDRGVAMAGFSPDGRWVLTCSADRTARVWDVATGRPVSAVMRHRDKVTFARFSPDGTLVLTGCNDGTARLWEARRGYPITEPLAHQGRITGVQFSPDGGHFLSIGSEDALRVWKVPRAPTPAPSWLSELAESIAGGGLDSHGDWVPVSAQRLEEVEKSCLSDQNEFYAEWARQFLVERFSGSSKPQ